MRKSAITSHFQFLVRRSSVVLALGALAFCSSARAWDDQAKQDNIDVTIAKIVKARDYAAQFVVLAKQQFKQGSPEYNQAFKLYASAYSDYSAWNAFVTSALASGRIKGKKPLPDDPQYDKLASSAVKSGNDFVTYVDTNTKGESKAVVALIASIADLGIKLWTQVSAKNQQDRTALAKRFSDATTWQTWVQVTDGAAPSPKPEPPPTKNGDGTAPAASADKSKPTTPEKSSDSTSKKQN